MLTFLKIPPKLPLGSFLIPTNTYGDITTVANVHVYNCFVSISSSVFFFSFYCRSTYFERIFREPLWSVNSVFYVWNPLCFSSQLLHCHLTFTDAKEQSTILFLFKWSLFLLLWYLVSVPQRVWVGICFYFCCLELTANLQSKSSHLSSILEKCQQTILEYCIFAIFSIPCFCNF